MVKEIIDIFYMIDHNDQIIDEAQANDFLSMLESSGMNPPTKLNWYGGRENKWEPENEKI